VVAVSFDQRTGDERHLAWSFDPRARFTGIIALQSGFFSAWCGQRKSI